VVSLFANNESSRVCWAIPDRFSSRRHPVSKTHNGTFFMRVCGFRLIRRKNAVMTGEIAVGLNQSQNFKVKSQNLKVKSQKAKIKRTVQFLAQLLLPRLFFTF